MKLTGSEIAKMIDISAVQASHGKKEIDDLAAIAKKHGFIAVHALPSWAPYLKKVVEGSGVMTGGPVGFPSGGHTTEVKILEAQLLRRDGVDEMDMMLNVGKLLAGEYGYVEDEIRKVVAAAEEIPVKVILEVAYLSTEQIKRGCDAAVAAGAAFVKTGTGWAPGGTTVKQIEQIAGFVGGAVGIKASGGIRGLKMVKEMIALGVTRFGINVQASLDILEEVAAGPDGSVEI